MPLLNYEFSKSMQTPHDDHAVEIIEQSPTAKLLVNGSAIAAGLATKGALETIWKQTRHTEPPNNPAAPGVTWRDALIWAASVGAAMGVAKVLGRKGATETWRKLR